MAVLVIVILNALIWRGRARHGPTMRCLSDERRLMGHIYLVAGTGRFSMNILMLPQNSGRYRKWKKLVYTNSETYLVGDQLIGIFWLL